MSIGLNIKDLSFICSQDSRGYQIDFMVLTHKIAYHVLKGVLQPYQKLACFVLYLKINIFLKNDMCILQYIVQLTKK